MSSGTRILKWSAAVGIVVWAVALAWAGSASIQGIRVQRAAANDSTATTGQVLTRGTNGVDYFATASGGGGSAPAGTVVNTSTTATGNQLFAADASKTNFAAYTPGLRDITKPPYSATTGSSDNTAAIQAAVATVGAQVWIPEGTYILTTIFPTNGVVIDGPGKLIKKAATIGAIIDSGTNFITVQNITLDGNGAGTNYTTSSRGSVQGLYLYCGNGYAAVKHAKFYNFNGEAIILDGTNDVTGRPNHGFVLGCSGVNNQTGIRLAGTNRTEYCTVSANDFRKGYIGLENPCANVLVTGNNFTDNGLGWYARPDNGRSHSIYSGNTVNHSSISFYNASTGANVTGNNFFGSTTVGLLSDTGSSTTYSIGVVFKDNYFENPTVSAYGSATNFFIENTILGAATWNGGGVIPVHTRNRIAAGGMDAEGDTLTDAATVTPWSAWPGGILSTISQNITIANPTGTAGDGQEYWLRLTSTTSRTITWGSEYRDNGTVTLPSATTANKTDYLRFRRSTAATKWDLVEKVMGF